MPLLRLMLHRAPKLTARKFYAPLLHLMRNRATNRKQCAETEVNHISQTPPEAGTRRGVAFEPLCVPPEKGAPRVVAAFDRSRFNKSKDVVFST